MGLSLMTSCMSLPPTVKITSNPPGASVTVQTYHYAGKTPTDASLWCCRGDATAEIRVMHEGRSKTFKVFPGSREFHADFGM